MRKDFATHDAKGVKYVINCGKFDTESINSGTAFTGNFPFGGQ